VSGAPAGLRELAWGAGVATAYHDTGGVRHDTSPDVLRALLDVLGLPAGDAAAVADSHRLLHRRHWDALASPTTVCWADEEAALEVRRPAADHDQPVAVEIGIEHGSVRRIVAAAEDLVTTDHAEVEGVGRIAQRVRLGDLPLGAHRVVLDAGGRCAVGCVLVAPRLAPALGRGWGVFAPVYALHGEHDPRPGTLGELRRLADWVAALGGDLVGTLPLLATFDDDASPYAPVSRLAWNERHLDLAALPEAAGLEPTMLAPAAAVDADRDLIDWNAEVTRIQAALATMASGMSDRRRAELDAFTVANPHVDELACWRAEVDQHGPPRPGQPLTADRSDLVRYHRYTQWAMEMQLADLSEHLGRQGQALYLDLPLGVHPDGFDVWRSPELFALGLGVGAPPDDFMVDGQDWGFPPIRPDASRADGHAYLRAGLAHQLRHAGVVRIDHVMALHRLWWIPPGAGATDGAYVHYPAEELAAVVTLEAWRAGAVVIGENLGTVPDDVNALMAEHRLLGMYATQFEMETAPHARPAPAGSVAVVNTHDMEPFAAFWQGTSDGRRTDVVEQIARDGQGPASDDPLDVLEALLGWLGQSEAASVVVTLEDLWGEQRRQNRPGTGADEPNWRRRTSRTLDEIAADPDVARRLGRLRAARGVGEDG
jgi:4-alpha-glucanotransferase